MTRRHRNDKRGAEITRKEEILRELLQEVAIVGLALGAPGLLISFVALVWLLSPLYKRESLREFAKTLRWRRFLALGGGAYLTYVVFTSSVNLLATWLVWQIGINPLWVIPLSKLAYLPLVFLLWATLAWRSRRDD